MRRMLVGNSRRFFRNSEYSLGAQRAPQRAKNGVKVLPPERTRLARNPADRRGA